ncbi:MAG: hypothetical protein JXJ04_05285 [Spirochaetales bacterium]|nr:hypothetical protein [Spirochaetales bacterium]
MRHHKFIPDYYDNFEIKWNDKTLYGLVMEYIDGKNLHECIKEGVRFSVDEVKSILEKLLSISDIYSLGVTILFLLTGKDPSTFNLKNMRIDYRSFVNISGDFKHLIDKMIDPDLEKRIKDADRIREFCKEHNIKEE